MKFPLLCVLFLLATLCAAQATYSVDMLGDAVRNALNDKSPDRELAAFISSIKLRERLDASTAASLADLGASPKTVSALKALVKS